MSPLLLLPVCIILIPATFGYSSQFGQVQPGALPIYESELNWNCDVQYKNYVDGSTNSGRPKFRFSQILVYDESPLETEVKAELINGGIGYNFTSLRLSCFRSENSQPKSAKVTICLYGLEVKPNRIEFKKI